MYKVDEEKEEVFETTGDNEEVIRKEFDEKEISVFEISPFNDEVSKEFKIECEIGTFSLGKTLKLQRHLCDKLT